MLSDLALATVIGLLLIALFKLVDWVIIQPNTTALNKLPGPKRSSWLMGNFWELTTAEPGECHFRWAREYGPIVHFEWLLNMPRALISSPEGAKHVLVTNAANYSKIQINSSVLQNTFGDGLLMVEGETHKQHRKIIQPIFNYANLVKMIPLFTRKTHELVAKWQALPAFKENGSIELDCHVELSNLTLDVIGLAAFAYDFNSVNNPGKVGIAYKKMMVFLSLTWKMMLHFIPGWQYVPTKDNVDIKDAVNTLNEVMNKMIEEKRTRKNEPGQETDLLDMMMQAADDDTGVKLTTKQLQHNIMTFMLAGHETTSVAMSWVLYVLSQHPEVELKLLEELHRVLGNEKNPTIADLDKLVYLENVIRETLRLYSPIHVIGRVAREDDEIHGYKIPKGSKVVISTYSIHRLESYFPDPERFDPDRWNDEKKEGSLFSYLPFNVGSRSCIGARFARLEMKAALSILLRKFSFKLRPGFVVKRKVQLTTKPYPGLPMIIQPRA